MPTPTGWRWVKLTEVARMESGHTPSRNHPEYWHGDIPWMAVGDARGCHGGVINDTKEHTNEAGIANSSARLLPTGTVCLSRGGSVGYVVITGRPMATSQGFVNWICSKELDPKFLQYLFLAEQDSLDRFAIGATLKTIYYPEVKAFHICMPPIEEQWRIVAVLDEAFAAIATATANTEENLANASELFQAGAHGMFADLAQQAPLAPLGDLAERITKGSSPKWQGIKYVEEPGILFVTSENVGNYELLLNNPKYVEEKFNLKDKKSILKRGDVLTNIVGASIGRTAIYDLEDNANINQAVCLIRCNNNLIHNGYLAHLLNTSVIRNIFHENKSDMARANLSLGFFSALLIPCPSIDVQREIVVRLDELHRMARDLGKVFTERLATLSDLRQSMLRKAFSGALGTPHTESIAA